LGTFRLPFTGGSLFEVFLEGDLMKMGILKIGWFSGSQKGMF
jgi:hypothetical protein